MKWHHRFTFRFWLAINVLVFTGIISFNVANYWKESSQLEKALRNEGITAANTFNQAIGLYMLQGNYSLISPLAYALVSGPNIAYVIVKDKDGITVNQKGETTIDDENIIKEKVPLEYFQEKVGEVEIALRTDSLQEKQGTLLSETVYITLLISILSLILSYLISRRLTQPINKLIAATKKMAAGDRYMEVIKDDIFEIQQLADSFNNMAKTISDHENHLVDEIQKATKDLSQKVSILEVLETISSSVLEDNIQRIEVMKSILVSLKKHSNADRISLAFLNSNKKVEVIGLEQTGQFIFFEPSIEDTLIHTAMRKSRVIMRIILLMI